MRFTDLDRNSFVLTRFCIVWCKVRSSNYFLAPQPPHPSSLGILLADKLPNELAVWEMNNIRAIWKVVENLVLLTPHFDLYVTEIAENCATIECFLHQQFVLCQSVFSGEIHIDLLKLRRDNT